MIDKYQQWKVTLISSIKSTPFMKMKKFWMQICAVRGAQVDKAAEMFPFSFTGKGYSGCNTNGYNHLSNHSP
ncbi:MAG: hypothetical protein ABSF32_08350 [Ignavibacteria bacterium]|jgi:hypothetical protein